MHCIRPSTAHQLKRLDLKEIILLGNADIETLKRLENSPHYTFKKTQNIDKAEKLIHRREPDFVLCSGTIKVNPDGSYFIDIS